ncbi:hypothetical protein FXN61_45590, partial [Lentzea sp. PSKA42]
MTEFEKRLIEYAQRGELLVCPASAPAVRAELIRELLLGRHGELDPSGVQLQGARIKGAFDLDRVTASVSLYLHDCVIDEPIEARYAHLRALTLHGGQCVGLQADGVHIDADLYLEGGLQVEGSLKDGLIRLVGSHIEGDLSLNDVAFTNKAGSAFHAERIRIGGAVFMRKKIRITGHGEDGAINLSSASIAGDLRLDDHVRLTNLTGPALNADDIRIQGSAVLENGFRAVGHGEGSAVSLGNANVVLNISLSDAEITNRSGCGFDVDSARVGGSVFLGKDVKISGHGKNGAIDVAGARIGGNLELEAEVCNDLGPALNANSVDVGESLFLHNGGRLTARDTTGAIDLISGHIAGALDFRDVVVTNSIGPAVCAEQVHVDGELVLQDPTRLIGNGNSGAVALSGARISRLNGWSEVDVQVKAGRGPVFDLQEVVVGTSVTLPPALMCLNHEVRCSHRRQVRLDEFSYASLGPGWDWQQWLHLIRRHTPAYHASAYQRLAAVERAAGHDGTVRQILMAQQTDLRRRNPKALGGPLTQWFHWLWGALAGYGYRARRTAGALLLVLAMAGFLGWAAGQVATRPG